MPGAVTAVNSAPLRVWIGSGTMMPSARKAASHASSDAIESTFW